MKDWQKIRESAQQSAPDLLDGGWRENDVKEFMKEYGCSREKAKIYCEEIGKLEAQIKENAKRVAAEMHEDGISSTDENELQDSTNMSIYDYLRGHIEYIVKELEILEKK